jgi:hypothetical protein
MADERTWKIRTWDCDQRALGPEREITLAQYRAEVDAANAKALAIYKANVEALTSKPDYRFKFQIVDESTGEVVEADWCTINDERIDEFGASATVEIHISKMLRNWRNFARDEYEAVA